MFAGCGLPVRFHGNAFLRVLRENLIIGGPVAMWCPLH
jgi:hypothetical protein